MQPNNPAFPCGCSRCYDFGLWLTPVGIVAECPRLQLKLNDHKPLTPAAEIIRSAGIALARRGYAVTRSNDFKVARTIARGTSEAPVGRDHLLEHCFEWAGSQRLRHLHHAIEELRCEWHLPIGSRKNPPYGYWMILTPEEMADWARSARTAPIKQLVNIRNAMKANFPELATQPEFDFAAEFEMEVAPR